MIHKEAQGADLVHLWKGRKKGAEVEAGARLKKCRIAITGHRTSDGMLGMGKQCSVLMLESLGPPYMHRALNFR